MLRKLQTLLGELYALDVPYFVDDFVTTDANFAQSLDTSGRPMEEKLLIAESAGEADVALYLDRALLELELQAEVDKFVATDRLLRAQHGQEPVSLHRWLFDLPTRDDRLHGAELERYRRANRCAGKYCRRLAPALARDDGAVERALRRYYRLSQTSKLAHIGM